MIKLSHVIFVFFLSVLLVLPLYAADEEYEDFDSEQSEDIESESEIEDADVDVDEIVSGGESEPFFDKETESGTPDVDEELDETEADVSTDDLQITPNVKRVTGVEFHQKESFSQIIIKLNEPAEYRTFVREKENILVIHVKNATLPTKWKRFLDTSEFRSAVSFVRPFGVKSPRKSAKFVIQMRDRVAADVKREGSNIVVEVEIPDKYYQTHPKDEALAAQKKLEEEAAKEIAEAEAEVQAELEKKDAELAKELKNDGEFVDGKLDADQIVAEDDIELGKQGKDFSADEYLGVSISEIEGFTIKELEEDHKYTGKNVTVHFKNAELAHVMDFISEISGMNIVLGDDVKGKVFLKLINVPWDQALSIVLRTKGYGAVRYGTVIRISKMEALRKEQLDAAAAIDAAKKAEPLKTFVIPLSYSKASEMQAKIKDFLTEGRGKITVDDRTNTIVIQDIERNIIRIKNLLEKLDTQTPQVLIEARIVEVSESFSRGFNIDWASLGDTLLKSPLTTLSNISLGVSPDGFKGSSNAAMSIGFLNLDKIGDVTMNLRIGEERNMVKLLSAPRIVTQDNKPATIKQTEQMTVTNKVLTTSAGEGDDAAQTTEEENITLNADLSLTVTPHITSDGGVVMDVQLINEYFKNTKGAKGSRSATTNILVENGDTTVIGGIYSTQVNNTRTGVPILSWLPIIGWFFSSYEKVSMRNELLIFLTPTITNIDKAFVTEQSLSDDEKGDLEEDDEGYDEEDEFVDEDEEFEDDEADEEADDDEEGDEMDDEFAEDEDEGEEDDWGEDEEKTDEELADEEVDTEAEEDEADDEGEDADDEEADDEEYEDDDEEYEDDDEEYEDDDEEYEDDDEEYEDEDDEE